MEYWKYTRVLAQDVEPLKTHRCTKVVHTTVVQVLSGPHHVPYSLGLATIREIANDGVVDVGAVVISFGVVVLGLDGARGRLCTPDDAFGDMTQRQRYAFLKAVFPFLPFVVPSGERSF